GVAFGPDGLYVAPLFGVRGDASAILKLRYAPAEAHPFVIDDRSPASMLGSLGCMACNGSTEGRRELAPSLEPRRLVGRLRERLWSPEYERAALKSPQTDFLEARREVLRATGKDRVRLWLKHR